VIVAKRNRGLERSVRTFAADEACGAFLSGGTDSSTLTGLLAATTGKPAQTFSIGFAAEGYDEMHYARVAARHFRAAHHEYYVTPQDVIDAIPRIAATYDQPFGNASAVPTYYCAKLAREHGISRMLGGDGGDELYGGNSRYAQQHRFALYEKIPALLRSGVVEPIARRVPDATRFTLLRKARSYVRRRRSRCRNAMTPTIFSSVWAPRTCSQRNSWRRWTAADRSATCGTCTAPPMRKASSTACSRSISRSRSPTTTCPR